VAVTQKRVAAEKKHFSSFANEIYFSDFASFHPLLSSKYTMKMTR
jgi:hypothetical protein